MHCCVFVTLVQSEEQLSGLARAEKLLVQAQKAVAARQADADAVNAVLEACEKRLAEAKQAKAAKRESDAAEAAAYGEVAAMTARLASTTDGLAVTSWPVLQVVRMCRSRVPAAVWVGSLARAATFSHRHSTVQWRVLLGLSGLCRAQSASVRCGVSPQPAFLA